MTPPLAHPAIHEPYPEPASGPGCGFSRACADGAHAGWLKHGGWLPAPADCPSIGHRPSAIGHRPSAIGPRGFFGGLGARQLTPERPPRPPTQAPQGAPCRPSRGALKVRLACVRPPGMLRQNADLASQLPDTMWQKRARVSSNRDSGPGPGPGPPLPSGPGPGPEA